MIDAFINVPQGNAFNALGSLEEIAERIIRDETDERNSLFSSLGKTLRMLRNRLYLPIAPANQNPLIRELVPGLDPAPTPTAGMTREVRDKIIQIQQMIQQELYIQRDMETSWENLVETMASDYVPYDEIFGTNGIINQLLEAAILKVGGVYQNPEIRLPADGDSTLALIATTGPFASNNP